jgi:hypothetical protein
MVIGRKNYLFAGNADGGRAAATLYTMVESAKRCGVDPQRWLADVLARVTDTPPHELADLLPDRWKLLRENAAVRHIAAASSPRRGRAESTGHSRYRLRGAPARQSSRATGGRRSSSSSKFVERLRAEATETPMLRIVIAIREPRTCSRPSGLSVLLGHVLDEPHAGLAALQGPVSRNKTER